MDSDSERNKFNGFSSHWGTLPVWPLTRLGSPNHKPVDECRYGICSKTLRRRSSARMYRMLAALGLIANSIATS